MMYQVLIADDESYVIKSLCKSIDWEKMHLKIEATVNNGEDAFDILTKKTIDIVITDIRMPGLNGLELCHEIHQLNPNIQIIMISGYADFSYAQKAIKYGVIGYCLKPIEYDEMTGYLKQAILHLSKKQYLSYDDLLEAINTNSTSKIIELVHGFGMTDTTFYVAASIGDTILPVQEGKSIILKLGKDKHAYLTQTPINLEGYHYKCKSPNNRCIGIINSSVPFSELKVSIEKCLSRAYQFFIDSSRSIFSQDLTENAEYFFSQLKTAIALDNSEMIIRVLNEIKCSPYQLNFTIKTAVKLCNMIFTSNSFHHEKEDYYIYSFNQLVDEYNNFAEMLDALIKLIPEETSSQFISNEFTNISFLNIIKYINYHYDKDLSLTNAASYGHLNPNYVSQLFKKEAGTTFSKYLTELRITKAKDLLKSEDLSISDIAMKVGFNDYFYFLKTFKRITGKTPSEYRPRITNV